MKKSTNTEVFALLLQWYKSKIEIIQTLKSQEGRIAMQSPTSGEVITLTEEQSQGFKTAMAVVEGLLSNFPIKEK